MLHPGAASAALGPNVARADPYGVRPCVRRPTAGESAASISATTTIFARERIDGHMFISSLEAFSLTTNFAWRQRGGRVVLTYGGPIYGDKAEAAPHLASSSHPPVGTTRAARDREAEPPTLDVARPFSTK